VDQVQVLLALCAAVFDRMEQLRIEGRHPR
jgi:hypothetical protein